MIVLPDALHWPIYGRKSYRWIMEEFDDAAPGTGAYAPYTGVDLEGPFEFLVEGDALIDKWSLAGEEEPEPTRTYMPLDGTHPTLFLQFAATPPTKEGVLDFIDKFGVLGLSYMYKVGDDRIVGVEPLQVWGNEISGLRETMAYWKSIKDGEFIPAEETQSLETSYRELQKYFKIGLSIDYPYSFKHFLLSQISMRINYTCKFEPNAVVNSDESGIDFEISPTNLLSAIWLQFAGAVSTDAVYSTCEYCGELFKAKRKSARYCSESHRQMAYRKRKEARS